MAQFQGKKEGRGNADKIKFWMSTAFKAGLIIFGIFNLFGYFSFTGDIIAAITLFLLWIHFDPIKLIFGNDKKWISYLAILIFYIFTMDIFVQEIQNNIDVASPEFQIGYKSVDSFLIKIGGSLYTPFRNFIIDVHNASIDLSFFSAIFGFILIIAISLYIARYISFRTDSMAYPLFRFFRKNPESWNNMNAGKSFHLIIKFTLTFFSLLIFMHYFFALVTQWFLVTISKSTFVLAFLFVVKDLKNTGVNILDKMGGFDESLIALVKKVFHDPRYFFTGFSILLAFHYISDINTFYISYIIPYIPLEGYYLSIIGGGTHFTIPELIASEGIASFAEKFIAVFIYGLSALGAFFLFMIPVVFTFMTVSKKNVKDYLERKNWRILLYIMLISMTVFIISPWMSMRGLYKDSEGNALSLYGVDFNTNPISDSGISFTLLIAIVAALSALCWIFAKSHWMQEYSITIVFIYSLVYLGFYVWNFFTSAMNYYVGLIKFSFAEGSIAMLLLFSILLVMESIFYIAGFFYMGYKISREIITQKTKYIVTDSSMIIWTAILFMIPMLFLFNETSSSITTSSIVIASLFIFNYALYREFTGIEHKDDYILSISFVVAVFQIILISEKISLLYFGEGVILIIGVVLLLLLSFFSIKFFNIDLRIKGIEPQDFGYVFIFGLAFGILFYFAPDPLIANQEMNWKFLVLYLALIAIAEEVLFRGVVMNIAEKAFSFNRAVFLQSLVFMLVHFIGVKSLIEYYSGIGYPVMLSIFYIFIYAVLLYSFGMFSAMIYRNREKNLAYPILFHFVVNAVPLLMYAKIL